MSNPANQKDKESNVSLATANPDEFTIQDSNFIFERSLNEIYVYDVESLRFIDVNRGARTNLGYTLDQLRQLTPHDLKPEFTGESFHELLEPLRQGAQEEISFNTIHRRKDGTDYGVEVHLRLATWAGHPAFIAIVLDVSERLRTENVFKRLIDSMSSGLIVVSRNGGIDLANPQVGSMFGYQADELISQSIETLIPKRYRAQHTVHRNLFFKAMEQRPMGAGRDLYGLKKNGTEFPIEIGLTPIENEFGPAVLCSIVDITERKKSDNEKDRLLRELDNKNDEITCLYLISELLRPGEIDKETLISVANAIVPGFSDRSVTGVRISFDGRRYESKNFSETPRIEAARIVVSGRQRGDVEAFFGEQRAAIERERFGTDKSQLLNAITVIISEMIERVEAEAKVIQASKMASVGELAAGVGHEINNPINGILNCAEILLKRTEKGTKDYKFLELIHSESSRVASIVNSLLTFSRQEKAQFSLAQFSDIVRGVLALCKKRLEKSHIELLVEVPGDLPRLSCRSEQLQQVLMNLIINAAHALDEHYPQRDSNKVMIVSATSHTTDGIEFLRFTVRDNGTGITPENLERVFDPFFTTKGRDKGTGLGLSVSSGIVNAHGGTIDVSSRVGEFTEFVVDIPLKPKERN